MADDPKGRSLLSDRARQDLLRDVRSEMLSIAVRLATRRERRAMARRRRTFATGEVVVELDSLIGEAAIAVREDLADLRRLLELDARLQPDRTSSLH